MSNCYLHVTAAPSWIFQVALFLDCGLLATSTQFFLKSSLFSFAIFFCLIFSSLTISFIISLIFGKVALLKHQV